MAKLNGVFNPEGIIGFVPQMNDVQEMTRQIDILQKDLEVNPNPITASILSKKHSELELLGFEYDVFNKELTEIK